MNDSNSLNNNDYIDQVLIGLLLGDSWLELPKVNARLRYEQSEIHSEYFFFVLKFFALFCTSSSTLRVREDKRTNKTYRTHHFTTRSLPYFTNYYTLFYPNKKKVVPQNIKDLLTPVSLAFWISDHNR
jgi:hypothetical protein